MTVPSAAAPTVRVDCSGSECSAPYYVEGASTHSATVPATVPEHSEHSERSSSVTRVTSLRSAARRQARRPDVGVLSTLCKCPFSSAFLPSFPQPFLAARCMACFVWLFWQAQNARNHAVFAFDAQFARRFAGCENGGNCWGAFARVFCKYAVSTVFPLVSSASVPGRGSRPRGRLGPSGSAGLAHPTPAGTPTPPGPGGARLGRPCRWQPYRARARKCWDPGQGRLSDVAAELSQDGVPSANAATWRGFRARGNGSSPRCPEQLRPLKRLASGSRPTPYLCHRTRKPGAHSRPRVPE